MTKLFKPVISLFRLYKRIKNFRISYKLLPEIFTPAIKTTIRIKGREILFKDYNKKISQKQLALFGKHGELLLKFVKAKNIFFAESNGKNEIISIKLNDKNILLSVVDYNSLKVIEEIFIDQLYDFQAVGEYIVCDVGMNVAAASLYFSSFENIRKIYGYEPFPHTFEMANKNIDLNTGLKHKIQAFNCGLGKTGQLLTVPYPENGFLGGTTTGFVIDELAGKLKTRNISVEIKSICDEIGKIKQQHPLEKIILKLDCEGAEYEIIEELDNKNMLKNISICMIEFHLKGKKKLVDLLFKNHFIVMSPVSEDINLYGMVYAIRQ